MYIWNNSFGIYLYKYISIISKVEDVVFKATEIERNPRASELFIKRRIFVCETRRI